MTDVQAPSTASSVIDDDVHGERMRSLARRTSPVAMIGLLLILIIVFGILRPATFLTWSNASDVLGQNSVLVIIALAAMIPLIADEFDLSVAYVLGLSAALSAGLTSKSGLSVVVAVVIVLGLAVIIGLVHSLLIVRLGLPSFVTTLATGTIIYGATLFYTGGNVIFGLPPEFKALGTSRQLGLELPVFYALVISVVLWLVLDKRPWGRNLYAVGAGRDAAKLAGLKTDRLRASSLVIGSLLAAVAGVVFAARIGAATPTAATSFFLPVFAAVFLGTAAFKVGFFNVWGTVCAVLLIGVGVTGLNLMGVPFWVEPMFNGFALLVAILFSKVNPLYSR